MNIESMWGTCDGHGIVFTQVSYDTWTCDVPADLEDGKYIVEIFARTHTGFMLYTTAVLYMCDSKCVSLELMNDGYYVVIKTVDYDVKVLQDDIDVRMNEYTVKLLDDVIKVVVI